jgi:hypothetical protein
MIRVDTLEFRYAHLSALYARRPGAPTEPCSPALGVQPIHEGCEARQDAALPIELGCSRTRTRSRFTLSHSQSSSNLLRGLSSGKTVSVHNVSGDDLFRLFAGENDAPTAAGPAGDVALNAS